MVYVAHHRALKTGSVTHWSSNRALCNKATSMLWSAKTAYFNGLISSLSSNFGDTSNVYLGVLRHWTKSTQISATTNDFNNHFFGISIRKIVANVTSTVPATVFAEKIFKDKTIPFLMFAHVDTEIVSSVVTSLDLHKLLDLMVCQLGASGLLLIWWNSSLFYLTSALTVLQFPISGRKLLHQNVSNALICHNFDLFLCFPRF